MLWNRGISQLQQCREPGILVTLIEVRGHAPRDVGSKMTVSIGQVWGSIGGGNLEETAVRRAREILAGRPVPRRETFRLNDKEITEFGTQCCGGEVEVLFDELPVAPAIAIFGMGHVGWELARILARREIELHLVDSRAGQLAPERLSVLADAVAQVYPHTAPVPEIVLGEIPAGSQVLILTHDHAEDAALCDMALRCTHLGGIGLIGSSAKLSRFRSLLAGHGHSKDAIAQIRCPIGVPNLTGKHPATIALAVAAQLVIDEEAAARAEHHDAVNDHLEVQAPAQVHERSAATTEEG